MEFVTDKEEREQTYAQFLSIEPGELPPDFLDDITLKLQDLFRKDLRGATKPLTFSGPVDVVMKDEQSRYYIGLGIIDDHREHSFYCSVEDKQWYGFTVDGRRSELGNVVQSI